MLLVVLDCEAYAQIDHDKRLKERCQAWMIMVKECGIQALKYRDPSGPRMRHYKSCLTVYGLVIFGWHDDSPEITDRSLVDFPYKYREDHIGQNVAPEGYRPCRRSRTRHARES